MKTGQSHKILFVTTHNPWGTGGGCYATRLYLSALAEIFPDSKFDICLYDRYATSIPADWNKNPRFRFFLSTRRPLTERLLGLFDGRMHRHQKTVRDLLKKNTYNLCFLDKSTVAGSLLRHIPANTLSVTLHHNFEPDYFKVDTCGRMVKTLFAHHVRRFEKRSYLNSSINLFLSEDDRMQFRKEYGETRAACRTTGLFSPGDDYHALLSAPDNHTAKTIVISGSLNTMQNIDGITHFFNDLYHLIPADYRIIITGQHPTPEIRALCEGRSNVQLIPDPGDILGIVTRGSIAVCPTRTGSGIKIRITDPLKCGIPVIAHSVSARGYSDFVKKGYIRTYKTPADFAEALQSMQKDIDSRKMTSEAIYDSYNHVFNRQYGIMRLRNALTL